MKWNRNFANEEGLWCEKWNVTKVKFVEFDSQAEKSARISEKQNEN